jgi:hypothetical protein
VDGAGQRGGLAGLLLDLGKEEVALLREAAPAD